MIRSTFNLSRARYSVPATIRLAALFAADVLAGAYTQDRLRESAGPVGRGCGFPGD
jgi:hypothetical protein